MKIKRITIDIDKKDFLFFSRAYALIILLRYGYHDFTVRHSASGKHWHVIAWHDIGHDITEHLHIRKVCGDDKARIYFDEQKNRTINILFSKKRVVIFKDMKELRRKLK